jgi:PHD/YefM family antitoxin component YafN of YafNO toxin-antitoxin module
MRFKQQNQASTEQGIMSTTTLDISEARRQFTKLDKRLREDRVIWITRHNKKAFAIVETDLFQTVLETIDILSDPDALKMFQEGLQDIRAGRLHDHEDVKSELLNGTENHDPMDNNREGIAETSPGKSPRRPAKKGR